MKRPTLPTTRAGTRARAAFALFVIVVAFATSGCPCAEAITEASPSLRWWLFSNFGAQRVCPEMLKHGVALRLQDRAPAIGRFFPTQCTYSVNDAAQTLQVSFGGTGYGYMSPAKRVGFSCTATVEYRPDFQISGDDTYVWARINRIVQGPNFQLGYVENGLVDVATAMTPLGGVANFFGNQIVAGELTRGFTVLHNADKGDDFALGLVFPPERPHHPFDTTQTDRFTFANEIVDINGEQRDYLGPFEIAEPGQYLLLTMTLQGPAVDVMVVNKTTGDAWREAYQKGMASAPPGPILAGAPLQPGLQDTRRINLAPGLYYVVVDNTSTAGLVSPPAATLLTPFGAPNSTARLSYLAQLGE